MIQNKIKNVYQEIQIMIVKIIFKYNSIIKKFYKLIKLYKIDKNIINKGSNEKCETVDVEDENGVIQKICECITLNPVTIIDDVDGLFADSLADEVFSSGGFDKLSDFKFWESGIFYLFTLKTIYLIYCLYTGYKADKKQI